MREVSKKKIFLLLLKHITHNVSGVLPKHASQQSFPLRFSHGPQKLSSPDRGPRTDARVFRLRVRSRFLLLFTNGRTHHPKITFLLFNSFLFVSTKLQRIS